MGKMMSSIPYRRSARVNIGCPIRISGLLPTKAPFSEDAQILTISKFGAKIKTSIPLKVGMQVKVQPLKSDKSGLFKVVWVGREGTPRAGEVGIEYNQEIATILGINFPDLPAPSK
jgi:hypothetical protein